MVDLRVIEQPQAAQKEFILFKEGVALHSGRQCRVSIGPSKNKAKGIRFLSTFDGDLLESVVSWERVCGTTRSTSLVLKGKKHQMPLRTVEHFLAACVASNLWNIDVEISSKKPVSDFLEMPIFDGSAKAWMDLLDAYLLKYPQQCAKAPSEYLVIQEDLIVYSEDSYMSFEAPKDGKNILEIDCTVDFGTCWKQNKSFVFDWSKPIATRKNFYREIASARTFGFTWEIEDLKKRNLIVGASLDSALLLDEKQVLNREGFMLENELAAHKILDALGDLALLGQPLVGKVTLHKAGHSLHTKAIRELIEKKTLRSLVLNDSPPQQASLL